MSNENCQVATIIDGGIDWLTLTCSPEQPEQKELRYLAMQFQEETAIMGDKAREQAPQGFHGMGNHHIFWGHRDSLLMVKVYGRAANEFIERTRRAGVRAHCTRIDAQVTADYPERPATWAAARRDAVRAAEERLPVNNRRQKRLFEDGDCDTGLTIGARKGDVHRRIYDPRRRGHLEYPESAIRFEVEFKHDTARIVYDTMMKAEEHQYACAGYVQGELMRVGLTEPWFPCQEVPIIPPTYKPTDDYRRIMWLRCSVGPAVTKLLINPDTSHLVIAWFNDLRCGAENSRVEAALKAEDARRRLQERVNKI